MRCVRVVRLGLGLPALFAIREIHFLVATLRDDSRQAGGRDHQSVANESVGRCRARPNFMKVAPILDQLECAGAARVFVHTGQHYDASMSDAFLRDLSLPDPDFHLGVGSGSHARQTARVMEAFEPVLTETRPDWVVVVGDVNSTLACALVASKLRPTLGCRIAHVEAGLRSNDWTMPEEVNRVLTDRLSDLLLTPLPDAEPNLLREGIAPERIISPATS